MEESSAELLVNKKLRLSPTAISCYYGCPRKFFYVYIKKIKEKPTPARVRGKITHEVLNRFFNFVNITEIQDQGWGELWLKFRKVLFSLLKTEWKLIGKEYPDPFKSEKRKKKLFEETKTYLDFYASKLAFSLSNKLKEMDKNSKWFEEDIKRFFFPKDRERRLELEEENMLGFVDKTMSLFGKGIAIVDYKTSKCPLPHFIPKSHLKQGKAYAFLWKGLFGELPRHISFYYMRTGESVYYPISEKDVEEIRKDVEEIRKKNLIIGEFPKKVSKLCGFCDFNRFCFKGKPINL